MFEQSYEITSERICFFRELEEIKIKDTLLILFQLTLRFLSYHYSNLKGGEARVHQAMCKAFLKRKE